MNIIQIVFIAGSIIISLLYWSQPAENGRESPPPIPHEDETTPLLSTVDVRQRNVISDDDEWDMV